jgi:hypothetical protein
VKLIKCYIKGTTIQDEIIFIYNNSIKLINHPQPVDETGKSGRDSAFRSNKYDLSSVCRLIDASDLTRDRELSIASYKIYIKTKEGHNHDGRVAHLL